MEMEKDNIDESEVFTAFARPASLQGRRLRVKKRYMLHHVEYVKRIDTARCIKVPAASPATLECETYSWKRHDVLIAFQAAERVSKSTEAKLHARERRFHGNRTPTFVLILQTRGSFRQKTAMTEQ